MGSLTLGSLFDGIGGWQLAAVHAGVRPVWSSEIEAFPLEVTRRHFPDTIQLGDVTKIDGGKVQPVDIICAGSPCQDLSVAGKRAGLAGGRSGLFGRAVGRCDGQPMEKSQDSSSGRTSLAHFQAIIGATFKPCSRKSEKPRFQCLNLEDGRMQGWCELTPATSHGACSTLSIGESPRDARESSLSQILQKREDVPQKYFLSPRACQGILRRARERGKELPPELKAALERQAK